MKLYLLRLKLTLSLSLSLSRSLSLSLSPSLALSLSLSRYLPLDSHRDTLTKGAFADEIPFLSKPVQAEKASHGKSF